MLWRTALLVTTLIASLISVAGAVDTVTFRVGEGDNAAEKTLAGRILITAQDGGLLFQARDGAIYNIEPANLIRRDHDETPFVPLSTEEIAASVLEELPPGFEVHATAHYVICHNTSPAYVRWCGGLFERLQGAFANYWSRPPRGLELSEPEFPLVAIVFADKDSYLKFAEPEVGAAAESMIGYYSQRTNRMVLYDLTGQAAGAARDRLSEREIVQMLSADGSALTVATVVHEATHQISFNSGVQRRFADNPVWLTEGMAMYFETPDLRGRSGWRTIGAVNTPRLNSFKSHLAAWNANDLQKLLESDDLFRQTSTAVVAYDAAWSLNYFLAKRKNDAYCGFLKSYAARQPLEFDSPETRLKIFTDAFGDVDKLNAEFVRFVQNLR